MKLVESMQLRSQEKIILDENDLTERPIFADTSSIKQFPNLQGS